MTAPPKRPRLLSMSFTRRQWQIVALLFVVALINYFDRQSLSIVAPRFQAELHLSDRGYGHIVSLFLLASAIAYAVSGVLSDRLGTRRSMLLFVGWWSLAEAATAFATTAWQLGLTRFCLGLGEPGLWVAAPKAVGELFERPRRSLAIGLYTMGATAGAVLALPVIATVTIHLPWRSIFLIDGAAGLLWLPFWWSVFRSRYSNVSPVAARPRPELSNLRQIIAAPSTWKFLVVRGATDSVWYFYLFWFPKYLLGPRGMTLSHVSHVAWLVYFAAGVGTVAGGLLSGRLIRCGWSVGRAYRRTMFIAALFMLLSPLCALLSSGLFAVLIASVIAMAHMAWLVTLTATVVELYPAAQTGTAMGLIAAGSGFGGMVSSELIAWSVTHMGYMPVFSVMAVLHPLALWLLWPVFLPKRAD